MKIAVASDNEKEIAHHFGKAKGFVIFEIENNVPNRLEYRENIGKSKGFCGSCNHPAMIKNIQDCDLVISYGMGRRIYEDLEAGNIKAHVTSETDVDSAVKQYLAGILENRTDKLH